ncbi:MAG: ribA/ribD-fused uncharacterized protein [Lentisphaeria bacterium]|jgi:ribA/ribD-fused uncharacterized protein
MFAPDAKFDLAVKFSRFDDEHMLATSLRGLFLDDEQWLSAEHYLGVMLAGTPGLAEKVRGATTAQAAHKVVKPWYRSKKAGWKNLRRVYMTRALFTLVQMYPEVKTYLLETGDRLIAETSLYDHYWGVGRDQRGENMLGRVWMDIRQKLRDDTAAEPTCGGNKKVAEAGYE